MKPIYAENICTFFHASFQYVDWGIGVYLGLVREALKKTKKSATNVTLWGGGGLDRVHRKNHSLKIIFKHLSNFFFDGFP